MPVASLAAYGLDRFDFLGTKTEGGYIPDVAESEAQDLTVEGVDFARSREIGRYMPAFSMRTLAECADYPTAEELIRDYKRSRNRLATLVRTVRGKTTTYRNVMIKTMQCQALPSGPISTASAGGSPTSGVVATWTLQLTEEPT